MRAAIVALVAFVTVQTVIAATCPATVLVTHPFADPDVVPNQCGRMMSVLSLAANGIHSYTHSLLLQSLIAYIARTCMSCAVNNE
jgi:hypothetical protein